LTAIASALPSKASATANMIRFIGDPPLGLVSPVCPGPGTKDVEVDAAAVEELDVCAELVDSVAELDELGGAVLDGLLDELLDELDAAGRTRRTARRTRRLLDDYCSNSTELLDALLLGDGAGPQR
jgi:hypothetical protein